MTRSWCSGMETSVPVFCCRIVRTPLRRCWRPIDLPLFSGPLARRVCSPFVWHHPAARAMGAGAEPSGRSSGCAHCVLSKGRALAQVGAVDLRPGCRGIHAREPRVPASPRPAHPAARNPPRWHSPSPGAARTVAQRARTDGVTIPQLAGDRLAALTLLWRCRPPVGRVWFYPEITPPSNFHQLRDTTRGCSITHLRAPPSSGAASRDWPTLPTASQRQIRTVRQLVGDCKAEVALPTAIA